MTLANFTAQERLVLIFLSTTLVVGGIVKLTKFQQTPALQIKTKSIYSEMADYKRVSHELNSGVVSDSIKPNIEPIAKSGGVININQATTADLQQLPGVGPTLADRIIAYRTEHGPFAQIEDLTQVKGIGTKMFEKIAKTISTD